LEDIMDYSQQVKQLNQSHIPMNQTDYYKFFIENGFIDHRIDAKIAYLKDRFGFVKGKDKIDNECITRLDYIGEQYFYDHIAPATQPRLYI